MLFNSYYFIFLFMPFSIFIAMKLRGQSLLRFITIASLIFYASHGHAWFILPMIFTTTVDFFLAKCMEKKSTAQKRNLLVLSLTLNVGLLSFFKYTGFLISTIEPIFRINSPDFNQILLPAGISFYTFQTISYMIDVYRGHAEIEKNFWRFAGFISFFPHLIAGPLTRHNQLIPALNIIAKVGVKPRLRQGLYLFSLGLSKKVLIADRIAEFIDPLLAQPESLGIIGAWICMLGYTLQIYFDFSGYSDMAIGLGRLFNIELPQNFNAPYKSLDIVDFWRRWHITLSQWLRDYLYIPLGGNRVSSIRQKLNLMITMLLGGLWHGANWTFVAWGAYHGLLLIINHQLGGNGWVKITLISRFITFFLVGVGWIIFRSDNHEMTMVWIKQLIFGQWELYFLQAHWKLLMLVGASLIITQLPFEPVSKPEKFSNLSIPLSLSVGILAGFSIVFLSETSKFLYFQF